MKFAEANPAHVKMLLDYLLECHNRFCDDHPEIETIDAFMAVHNFHVVLVLSLEREYHLNTREQLMIREIALDTFRLALENKPAFRQER